MSKRESIKAARYNTEELTELQRRADRAGMTISQYIRRMTLAATPPDQGVGKTRDEMGSPTLPASQADGGRSSSGADTVAEVAPDAMGPGSTPGGPPSSQLQRHKLDDLGDDPLRGGKSSLRR